MKRLISFWLFLITAGTSFSQTLNPKIPDNNLPAEIPGMKLVWADEFNIDGKPDPAAWNYEKGFVRNEELQWYQEDNARCSGGVLRIEGRREEVPNPRYIAGSGNWRTNRDSAHYTSSSINTCGKKQWLYGRFEIRARIDTTSGSWPAIWTLGLDPEWPWNGEIDLLEFYRVNGAPTILANVAWGTEKRYVAKWDSEKIPYDHFLQKDPEWTEKFHVWRMDWTSKSIKLYLDGELLNETLLVDTVNPDGTNPFTKPQYLLLNLAIGGNGGNPDIGKYPIVYEVDYVRVYQMGE
jgi:beta-glucanase (GH16 family)